MRVQVILEIDERQALRLAGKAYAFGWSREEPRKRWTEPEYKEAARFVTQRLVEQVIHGD